MAAERRELEGLLVYVDKLKQPHWSQNDCSLDFARVGRLHGQPVALVANGPGSKLADEAVEIVRNHVEVDVLVSTGFCGALRADLQVGDIFAATEVVGVGPAQIPSSHKIFKTGKLLSVDRVVSTAAQKAKLAPQADAVEMEAASVAMRALQYSVPFFAVRVITDASNDSFPLDFNRLRSTDGHFSRAKILGAALRRPSVLPELIQLSKTTKRAAQALGDFLADARF